MYIISVVLKLGSQGTLMFYELAQDVLVKFRF